MHTASQEQVCDVGHAQRTSVEGAAAGHPGNMGVFRAGRGIGMQRGLQPRRTKERRAKGRVQEPAASNGKERRRTQFLWQVMLKAAALRARAKCRATSV
eukprot:787567-Pleurochrysis_carterae.AAC.1